MKRSCSAAIVLTLVISSWMNPVEAQAQEREIFWIGATLPGETTRNAIFRHAFSGEMVDTLIQATEFSADAGRRFINLTFDSLRNQIYWTDTGGTNSQGELIIGAILRISRDGSDPEEFLGGLICGVGSLQDIEVDPVGELLYWSQGSDCPFFGLSVIDLGRSFPAEMQSLNTSGNYSINAIEIDTANNMIYWTNRDFFVVEPLGILRAPLDETTSEEYIVFGSICDIALAHVLSKIYWTPCESSTIRRSDLDGSNVEDVLESNASIGKLAIDHSGGAIYWTEPEAGNIKRANLDGSGSEVILSGLSAPGSLALSFGGLIHTSVEPEGILPESPILVSVFPNPVRTQATVAFELSRPAVVSVEIYDLLGRKVEVLASGHFSQGNHNITWAPENAPGGVYVCRIRSGDHISNVLVVLQK